MAGGDWGWGGFGNGFGYLLLEGNSSTRIPPRGRLQSPPDSGTSGSRRNWEGAVGAYYSQHWEREGWVEGSLPSSNLLHTFFLQDPENSSPQHHEHGACTLGTCPSVGSGEWVNALWKVGGGYLIESPKFPTAPGPLWNPQQKRNGPLEIQLICTGRALVTQKQRCG